MNALETLKNHWAVGAIGTDDLDRAERLVHERLARRAVGKQIAFSFAASESDDAFLERTALAYEMAAIEGLDELSRPSGENMALRDQATAASFHAFDIRRLLPIPTETNDRLFFILQLSAAAYCGDRWSGLRRWFKDNATALSAPSVAEVMWDRRLLYRLFHCWVRLFRKRGWDDLDRIREIIAGLRDDQKSHEEHRLQNDSHAADRAIALRLAALYHWAKGTEILARYMLQGQLANPFALIDKHFEAGVKAATASGDAQHEVILRWLHAAARIMITNSLWWATRTVNSKTTDFVRSLTHREHQAMFELLPPQRTALLEQGLLDQAKTAIVVDTPTSGGKTLLAQFRILQALNQFFESLPDDERRRINALPAMIYHGVRSENAVPMRMNSAPRSAAENLGNLYREAIGDGDDRYSVGQARQFLKSLSDRDWQRARPAGAPLAGSGYKRVWEVLSGEASA